MVGSPSASTTSASASSTSLPHLPTIARDSFPSTNFDHPDAPFHPDPVTDVLSPPCHQPLVPRPPLERATSPPKLRPKMVGTAGTFALSQTRRRSMRRLGRGVWLGVAALALAGATRPGDRPPPVLIGGVPHIRQEPDFCGEACVAMYLRKLGYDDGQRAVFDRTGVDPLGGRGANTPALK